MCLVACAVDKLPDGPMACAVDKSSCPDRSLVSDQPPRFLPVLIYFSVLRSVIS